MASLATTDIVLPQEVANSIWHKAYQASTIAKLSGAMPQKFGQSTTMVLTSAPKAELVGEGDSKSPTPAALDSITVSPYKLHVTVRVNDEVLWADDDYSLDVWNTIEDAGGNALGRALDLVGMHKINPLTGSVAGSVTTGLVDTTLTSTLANFKYDEALDAAMGLIINAGYIPTGIAADPEMKFALSSQRDGNGILLYPNIGAGLGEFNYRGVHGEVSNTVSGSQEIATPTNILAFVGQFDAFKWGVQREIGAELIEYGDPDGLGDLKRKNQVALRMEIVYGIGIVDTDAFAVVLSQ